MRWVILLSVVGCASPPPPPPVTPPPPKVIAIPFKVESSNLTTGDEIEITSIHGDKPGCSAGGTYAIRGRYVLGSRADAELVVTGSAHQSLGEKAVARGSGEFDFTISVGQDGPLEAQFMKAGGGSSAGGIIVRCESGGAPENAQ
jgi:hypothetical protein